MTALESSTSKLIPLVAPPPSSFDVESLRRTLNRSMFDVALLGVGIVCAMYYAIVHRSDR